MKHLEKGNQGINGAFSAFLHLWFQDKSPNKGMKKKESGTTIIIKMQMLMTNIGCNVCTRKLCRIRLVTM